MLALSGSVLMVMLVSTLLFIPKVNNLQADIIQVQASVDVPVAPEQIFYAAHDPDEIIKMIREYVEKNDADTAKKLYDELYAVQQSTTIQKMGAEVSGIE